MLKNTAFLYLAALVACDGGGTLDGQVELRFRHYGLERYAVGADSYEFAFTVETPGGVQLARATVLTELGGFEDVVGLPCIGGQDQVVRATMIAAYEGRPHERRAGRGGLDHQPYTATQTFTCGSGSPAEVTWPGAGSVIEPELPWASSGVYEVELTTHLPAAFEGHEVDVLWDVDYRFPSSLPWRWVERGTSSSGDAATFYAPFSCEPHETGFTLAARPLLVTVDQVPLPRDTWRLPTLTATAPACVADEDVAIPMEATLELLLEVSP